jgi:phenylalanyl-tRNA synthetase alpha chain
MTQEDIRQVINAVQALDAKTAKEVEEARVRFLGKKGIITMLFEEFRNIPPEDKKLYGKELNMLKQQAVAKINELKSIAETNFACEVSIEDLSLPGFEYELGSRHPVSIVRQEIIDIFRKFGYDVAEGPEIDDDYHVFGALNFPPNHPARDMQDTFFVSTGHPNPLLLRTHTSSIQVRTMESRKPPIPPARIGFLPKTPAISETGRLNLKKRESMQSA